MVLPSASKKPVLIFLFFTLIFSSTVWVLTLHATDAGRYAGRIYGYGIMWCPALATVVTCSLTGRKISKLAWQWGARRYMVASYFIPMCYSMAAYIIIWSSGWGGFYNTTLIPQYMHELGWEGMPVGLFIIVFFLVNGAIEIIPSMATSLGEEIGWRGFWCLNSVSI